MTRASMATPPGRLPGEAFWAYFTRRRRWEDLGLLPNKQQKGQRVQELSKDLGGCIERCEFRSSCPVSAVFAADSGAGNTGKIWINRQIRFKNKGRKKKEREA